MVKAYLIEKRNRLANRKRELESMRFLVETNSGTYGDFEAVRKVRTAEKKFCDYFVWEHPGGRRYREGVDAKRAPGYARYFAHRELTQANTELREIVKELRELERKIGSTTQSDW